MLLATRDGAGDEGHRGSTESLLRPDLVYDGGAHMEGGQGAGGRGAGAKKDFDPPYMNEKYLSAML